MGNFLKPEIAPEPTSVAQCLSCLASRPYLTSREEITDGTFLVLEKWQHLFLHIYCQIDNLLLTRCMLSHPLHS